MADRHLATSPDRRDRHGRAVALHRGFLSTAVAPQVDAIAVVGGRLVVDHIASLELIEQDAPQRMSEVSAALGVKGARAVPALIRSLNTELGLPLNLRSAGFTGGSLDEMSEDAAASPFNRTSPDAPGKNDYKMTIMLQPSSL